MEISKFITPAHIENIFAVPDFSLLLDGIIIPVVEHCYRGRDTAG